MAAATRLGVGTALQADGDPSRVRDAGRREQGSARGSDEEGGAGLMDHPMRASAAVTASA